MRTIRLLDLTNLVALSPAKHFFNGLLEGTTARVGPDGRTERSKQLRIPAPRRLSNQMRRRRRRANRKPTARIPSPDGPGMRVPVKSQSEE